MREPVVETTPEAFRAVASDVAPGTRVPVAVRVRVDDPFEAYRRARGDEPSFYYETTGGQSGWGYFGVAPTSVASVSAAPGQETLSVIDELLSEEALARGDCPVPYPGGLFGWLSYDVARELESLPGDAVDDRGLPRMQLGTYETVAAWREPWGAGEALYVVSSPAVTDPEAAYERGLADATDLASALLTGDPSVGPPPSDAGTATFRRTTDPEEYADRVGRVKQYVRDGDTFQVNLSQRLVAPAAVHPVEAFAALRRVNPAPYSGLVEYPGVDLVSASPELLLHRDGGRLVTEPIAGTRPRGQTDEADRANERDLLDDEKERAEHAMLVDLERNDLGRVSEYGSVAVDEYRRVDRYSEVMHLVSKVTGTLRDDATLTDAIAATFPGGTITGAPKPRTMAIIDELESVRRGPYTGSMAAIGFDGNATLNIIIRTLVRHGEEYHLRVGGGIVHDSEPDREDAETLAKARALVTAVDEALGDRAGMEVTRR